MDYAGVVFLEILYMIAFLALTSAGLAVMFGMMRVINLAHGEFVMIGGYVTIFANRAGINIWFAMLVLAPLVVGAIGLVVERVVIRHLYGRMIDTMLATWGLSLLMVGLVTLIFGNTAVSVTAPIQSYQVGALPDGRLQPVHHRRRDPADAAALAGAALHALGLIARGAMQNADMASCARLQPAADLHDDLHRRRRPRRGWPAACWRRSTGLLPSSGAPTSPRRSSPSSPVARRSSAGTLSSALACSAPINQIVSFASTPVIGEIAMLALAIILLRLMPQGITGRFFRNST